MEEQGIGRPSTYASTADTLIRRGYISAEEKRFFPTELGRAVNQLLVEHFAMVVETEFTAHIEDALDLVEAGEEAWQKVVAFFYEPFSRLVKSAEQEIEVIALPSQLVDEFCPECGSQLELKRGRFGSFLACSGYPTCRYTKSIVHDTKVCCPKCGEGTLLERKSRRGDRRFYGCSAFPECDYIVWEKPITRICSACGGSSMSEKMYKRKNQMRYRCLNPDCAFEEYVDGIGEVTSDEGEDAAGFEAEV
jgi:DNA topoisomerase-1